MRIELLELRLLRLPLGCAFETSFARIDARAIVRLRLARRARAA